MKQILIYGDSLSWGIIPGTRQRLEFTHRWPGIMQQQLRGKGMPAQVIENCLNGRRTMWDDPLLPGRNGLQGIGQVIEMHSPLSLVILMLGTNDFQVMHEHSAAHAAQGIRALIKAIRSAPVEPGMPIPEILLLSPPLIEAPKGNMAVKFQGAETKSVGLAQAYRDMAHEMGCACLQAGDITPASRIDGIHLDEDQHAMLGEAIANKVSGILS